MTKEKRQERLLLQFEKMLEPLHSRLDQIEAKIGKGNKSLPKYYRNEDLKEIFGFSSNTIIKYRQAGILPFTKLGDIFLYDPAKIAACLKESPNGEY